MNTTLSTTSGRHDHPPEQSFDYQPRDRRRVNLLDRVALHLGVALIKWGRRPRAVESREQHASRVEQHLARLARQRAAERTARLLLPPR